MYKIDWFLNNAKNGAELIRCYDGRETKVINENEKHAQYHHDLHVNHGIEYYLKSSNEWSKPKISISDNICVSCEG